MDISPNRKIYHLLGRLIPNLSECLRAGKETGVSTRTEPIHNMLFYELLEASVPGEYVISLARSFKPDGSNPDVTMEIRVMIEKGFAEALSFENSDYCEHIGYGKDANAQLQNIFNKFLVRWLESSVAHGHSFDLSLGNTPVRDSRTSGLRSDREGRAPEHGR